MKKLNLFGNNVEAKRRLKEVLIRENETIRGAWKKLDRSARRVLLVVDRSSHLLGTLTDGDIRRRILGGHNLEESIKSTYNQEPVYIKKEDFSKDSLKNIMVRDRIELVPVLDKDKRVVSFITWDQIFADKENPNLPPRSFSLEDVPVVLMAGGRGTRLEPFSKIFPKPLIPVGEKPIIELIIEEFRKQGIKKYFLTLNYKGEMIISYFNNIEKDYKIEYVWEKDFLGTAGSLRALEDKVKDILIVSNCDVIVKADLNEAIDFHKGHNSSLTILSSIQHYKIPYGVINFKDGGRVTDVVEKPQYPLTVNTGVYILDKSTLRLIPKDSHLDMTDLIASLIRNRKTVTTYPINENDYIDIGQWDEYRKALDKIRLFK